MIYRPTVPHPCRGRGHRPRTAAVRTGHAILASISPNATNAPEWAAVKTGLFGGHITLVPLAQASWDGDTLTVPFDKAALNDAPHHDPDAAISAQDEDELYRHYGLSPSVAT